MSFEAEIKKHYPTWMRYAIGLCRSKDRGEEMLHEVLASLKPASITGEVYYYVNRAIYLSWIKTFKNKRSTVPLVVDIAEAPPPPDIDIDSILSVLNGFDRELFRLYLEPGFSFRVVSDEIGISESKLRTSISQSIKTLRLNVDKSLCA